MSLYKIHVTEAFGTDAIVGLIDPVAHMPVRYGAEAYFILSVDAVMPNILHLSLTDNGTEVSQAYTEDVQILYSEATANWSYPGGGGSVPFKIGPTTLLSADNGFVLSEGGTPQVFDYTNH